MIRIGLPVSGILFLALSAVAVAAPKDHTGEQGWTPLFDGKSLAGWVQRGGVAKYEAVDGAIVGTSVPNTTNSFLCTERLYGDFVLHVEFQVDASLNSGVQVRSQFLPGFVCKGYQPDIAQSRYTGILYEEGGRGILADVDPKQVAPHVKNGDWNQYVITCDGPNITIELNGYRTVAYTGTGNGASEGVIGLQLHRGPKMEVRFKDIEIRALP